MNKENEKSEDKFDIIPLEINGTIPSIDNKLKINTFPSVNMQNFFNSLYPLVNEVISNGDYIRDRVVIPMQELSKKLNDMIRPIIDVITSQTLRYSSYFGELAKIIEEARKNPDSLVNWYNYSEKLSAYLWTIPFDIDSKTLKNIFEQINSEKEFDVYMIKYFTKDKISYLFMSIENILPKKHIVMFHQVKKAFYDKSFSLSIVGIMAIIDELCSYFLIDKSCSGRQNLFVPIIKDLSNGIEENSIIIDLMILSNNINVIYENIEFNDKIKISTHKKARRNPCQHGRSFSNRKVDVIMLLNTMFNLLVMQKELKQYKNKIYKKNKIFYIPESDERKKIKIKIRKNIDEKKKSIN